MDSVEEKLTRALWEAEDSSRHGLRTLLQTREAMRQGVPAGVPAGAEASLPDIDRAIALLSRTLATAANLPCGSGWTP